MRFKLVKTRFLLQNQFVHNEFQKEFAKRYDSKIKLKRIQKECNIQIEFYLLTV